MKLGEALHGLKKLSATADDTHHRMYRVRCDGGHVVGVTKVSHKPTSMQLGPALIGAMASQLFVPRRFWTDLVGCTKDRADYLAARDHDRCR